MSFDFPAFVWLLIVIIVPVPLVYLAGRVLRSENTPGAPAAKWTALLVLIAAWLPFALAIQDFLAHGVLTYTLGAISLQMDGLALLLAGLTLTIGTIVVLYSGPYLASEAGEEKHYSMLVAMIGVIIGLGTATDLFNLWLWFETMAVTSFLLVVFNREESESLEAGFKFQVQSAVGSVFVLLGIAIVMFDLGTTDLSVISKMAMPSVAIGAAAACFVIGFGIKVALVPLHTWLPDAHSQAPSGISAMLSGVVIEAGLVALLRIMIALFSAEASWGTLLLIFAALNILVGNLMALRQTQVKRMLAYSSLAHMGYMLLGLGIAFTLGNTNGAEGTMFHMLTHGLMKGLAFLAAGCMLWLLHQSGSHRPLEINDLAGASQRYPLIAGALTLAVFALGGLPPFAGFMSKWQIFLSGFETNNTWLIALVIFAGLNSVLSLAYYAPVVNTMFRHAPSELVERGDRVPGLMQIPLALMAVAIVVIGFWPSLLNWITEPAGQVLLSAFGG
ncbi:MAG: hypothetical protein GYB68_00405 [Chloroflexi bacterium]|nr:hypothetical protein [Chloroflexota bacterium]